MRSNLRLTRFITRLGDVVRSRTWPEPLIPRTLTARGLGPASPERIRDRTRSHFTKTHAFVRGESASGFTPAGSLDRFLSLNVRTKFIVSRAGASCSSQVRSATWKGTSTNPHTGTETKAGILSKEPPVSSKKIHTPKKFPELATGPFFEFKSAASTTPCIRASLIAACHWRLKLAHADRYIACDHPDPDTRFSPVVQRRPLDIQSSSMDARARTREFADLPKTRTPIGNENTDRR